MRTIKRITLFFLLLSGGIASQVFGQDTLVQINQDSKIEQLVAIKKELDSERYNAQYFAIQLYYGNYTAAQNIAQRFEENLKKLKLLWFLKHQIIKYVWDVLRTSTKQTCS